jgi:hypothetical protein
MPPPKWTKLSSEVMEVFSASNQNLGTSTSTATSKSVPIPSSNPAHWKPTSRPTPIPPSQWKKKKPANSHSSHLSLDLGAKHHIGAPIQIYPLYENGFRAYRGQSIEGNNTESAELYAEFAKVAEGNPLAWNYGKPAETEKSIGSVSKKNRMICFPCEFILGSASLFRKSVNLIDYITCSFCYHC